MIPLTFSHPTHHLPTMANRLFSRPPAKELLTDSKASGSWRMPDSARSIKHARRLRAGSPWPARIHRLLTLGLILSFFSILFGVYLSLLHCGGSDSAQSEGCFTVAVCASVVFAGLVLAKCWWNARYPQD